MGSDLDEVDRGILFLLQHDARNTTAVEMAEKLDVSASTVRNRIEQLEEMGVLVGYYPRINYEHTDFPLLAIFVVTAHPSRRSEVVEDLLDIGWVLEVHEMLGGRENIHITVLARDNCHVSEITDQIHELDVEISRTEITKQRRVRSPAFFGTSLDGTNDDGVPCNGE